MRIFSLKKKKILAGHGSACLEAESERPLRSRPSCPDPQSPKIPDPRWWWLFEQFLTLSKIQITEDF